MDDFLPCELKDMAAWCQWPTAIVDVLDTDLSFSLACNCLHMEGIGCVIWKNVHTKPLSYVHYLSFTYSVSVWLERLWSRLLNYELYNNLCKKHNPRPVVDLQVHGLRAHESGGWVPIPDSSLTLTSFFLLHEKHFSSTCTPVLTLTECKVTVWEGNPATVTGSCAPGPCTTGFGSCLSEVSQNSQ